MPIIPRVWREDFIVNTNPNGSQSEGVVTVLASGHILVAWRDPDSSAPAGAAASADIIGRIFDSQGNAVTGEFLLNHSNYVDFEFNPSIAATPDGGFIVVYEENGRYDDINIESYGFNATTGAVSYVAANYIVNDLTLAADGDSVHSTLAVASATSAMVAYHFADDDGSDQILIRSYNPTTHAVGSTLGLFFGSVNAGEDVEGPAIAALSNGNYVIVFVDKNAGADDLQFEIRNTSGGSVFSGVVANTPAEMHNPTVLALPGGGFVIGYDYDVQNGNIGIRTFHDDGSVRTTNSPAFGNENFDDNTNEVALVALTEPNQFMVFWDNDTTGEVWGEHANISGNNLFPIGTFLVDNTGGVNIQEISASLFADGRFAVTWHDGSDIRIKIFDTRDAANATPVYTPSAQIVGTTEADIISPTSTARVVFGHDGADVIYVHASTDRVYGGNGGDTIYGSTGTDFFDGGAGVDTMTGYTGNDTFYVDTGDVIFEGTGEGTNDWVVATTSYTLNSVAQVESLTTASSGGTEVIHLTSNGYGQTIEGNAAGQTITGNGGNDWLVGHRGRDTLWGGADNDRFIFVTINDSGSAIASADRIMDFRDSSGQQDQIDLRQIDANTGLANDQAFVLDTNGSFSTGEIRQTFINGGADLLLEFNNDADATSDMAIVLVGITSVRDAADFLF